MQPSFRHKAALDTLHRKNRSSRSKLLKPMLCWLVLCLLFLVFTPDARADIETLRPVGPGNATNWSQYPARAAPGIRSMKSPGMTIQLISIPAQVYMTFMRSLIIEPESPETINSVTIHAWAARETGDLVRRPNHAENRKHRLRGYEHDIANAIVSTHQEITEVYVNNPNTGTAWTWTQIDAMEIGFARSAGNMRCTQTDAGRRSHARRRCLARSYLLPLAQRRRARRW